MAPHLDVVAILVHKAGYLSAHPLTSLINVNLMPAKYQQQDGCQQQQGPRCQLGPANLSKHKEGTE